MSEIGRYIYGIIPNAVTQESVSSGSRPECSDSRSFSSGSRSISKRGNSIRESDTEAVSTFGRNSNISFHLSVPQELSESEMVYAIPYQDISAIVSKSEIVDYIHLFKDTLARLLVGHQKVIEKIMGLGYTIIPVRLGTFSKNEIEIMDILTKGYILIKEIFKKINDKIEIDVVTTWSDFTSIIKEAGEKPEIKELKERLLKNPKGITVDDQMKVGFILKEALQEIRQNYTNQIKHSLKEFIEDFKNHELMDDKMVANFAFLIDKAKEKEFYAKVEELNTEFAEKLNFRCVGPLPPYSFYTLEIKKMNYQDVDWARRKLGILNGSITTDEIKKAFQRQALIFHPDRNPDKPGIERDFDDIKKSYDLLLDFAQACAQAGQERLVFNEDEFRKNAVLVKLKE